MGGAPDDLPTLHTAPLTPALWPALERLFGPRGACAGCWCMYWRQAKRDWETQRGETNREAFRDLVDRSLRLQSRVRHMDEEI